MAGRSGDQSFRQFCLTVEAGDGSVGQATVTLQELNHFSIPLTVGTINGGSTCVDVGVRIGSTTQQHLRHLELSGNRAVPERHTPRENDFIFVAANEPLPFVGIESKIQKLRQYLRL